MENTNQQTNGQDNTGTNSKKTGTANRGFASMKPDQQREIASKGGQAAHKQGVAHKWTAEEAREAGRKGGQASHVNRNTNKDTNLESNDSIGTP
ncbi:MAG: hypothetical protein H0X33_01705 [Taibaiella sp.]|nr:hypothetical protein [Taibaiella sp.]